MRTPRLAAILLGFIALETAICALLIGDSSPAFREAETAVFKRLFAAAQGRDDYLIDANLSETRVQYARPVVPGEPLPYLRVEVNNERRLMDAQGNTNDLFLFEKYPLTPLDWAVILSNASQAGYGTVAIAQPLTWQNAVSTELLLLNTRIKDFERSVLAVDLGRGPDLGGKPPEVPGYLARHAIPVTQVTGNATLFEPVNEVTIPPSATGGVETLFAFRTIETSEEPVAHHAFARWNDLLIPSLPVAIAMVRHEAGPEDIRIVMGSHIQVGKGPLIPIDENGRMHVEPAGRTSEFSEAVIAETLLEADEIPKVRDINADGVLVFATDTERTDIPWGEPTELQAMIDSIDTLPQPGPPVAHPRLPAWGETLFFGGLALVIALLLRLRTLPRVAAFAGALVLSLLVLFLLLRSTSTWIPVLPVVATCLVGLGLTFAMRRHAVAPEPKKKSVPLKSPPATTEPSA